MAGALAVLIAFAPAVATAVVSRPGDPAGDWAGTLKAGSAELRLAIHITKAGDGLAGTMDSIDQGSSGIPLSAIALKDGTLAFDVPSIGGHYSGAWDGAASQFAGQWTQNGVAMPLAFARGTVAARPAVAGLDGDWDGTLQVPTLGPLRLVFHIATGPAGTAGALASPDRGPGAVPFSTISRDGAHVVLSVAAINGTFDGQLSADGTTISGTWTQGQPMPLTIKRRAPGATGPAAANRPQTPKKPYPYREEQVAIDNAAGHSHLAGTLTLPQGSGPFSAAVLITGSGQQDRDETLLQHKPFLVLADYLTRRGIAVLRMDDRGVGGSTGEVVHATSADFAGDIRAAVDFLAARRDIGKVGLIGHSEGGLIAPMVAVADPKVAWIVMLAGPGIRGDALLERQQQLIFAADGIKADKIAKRTATFRRLVPGIEQARDAAAARELAKPVLAGTGLTGLALDAAAEQMSSDWFRYFLTYDPAPVLRQLRVPVLALNGSLDLQVPPAENLPAIRRALAGNPDVTVIEMPGLNHLFQTARTGAIAEYHAIEETMSPAALKTVADWIARRTG